MRPTTSAASRNDGPCTNSLRATPPPEEKEGGSSGSPEGGRGERWGEEEAPESEEPQLEGEPSFGPVGEAGGGAGSGSGDEESGGASSGEGEDREGKVLCEVWLDELIQALYEDLTEYVKLQSYR